MVFTSPAGLAGSPTANVLPILAIYKEELCHEFCVVSSNQPNATVNYSTEDVKFVGTSVFATVVAKVAISLPGNCGTKTYTEKFPVTFQGQTGLPSKIVVSSLGTDQGFFNVCCGRSKCYAVNDSITVTITPAA